MPTKLETFDRMHLRSDIPDIRPGDTVRMHQKIKEKNKERIQIFEGVVIARKHGKGISATITVRKVIAGVGVEKIFPIHTPTIQKIEVVKRAKVRRAKLYYLRTAKGKKARLKRKDFVAETTKEKPKSEAIKEKAPEAEVKKETQEKPQESSEKKKE